MPSRVYRQHPAHPASQCANLLRHAREALLELSGRPGMNEVCSPRWMGNLQVLANEDIRGLSEAALRQDGAQGSNGKFTISWIWKLEGAQDGPPDEGPCSINSSTSI